MKTENKKQKKITLNLKNLRPKSFITSTESDMNLEKATVISCGPPMTDGCTEIC